MNIPDTAIEAAARAMDDNFNPDKFPIMAAMFRDYAETALSAAAPFIAAQAKAEALREAAEALELPGSTDVGYYSGYTDNGYNQAVSDAEEWLTDRAETIEGKSE